MLNYRKGSGVWAITSYFNPARFKGRRPNYRIFRENLGVPLVTVELSFDGHFELDEKDADVLIRISGGAVLWQKERLLNIALKSVPGSVENIAWIDGDVIFERADWMTEADRQLRQFNVVQLLSQQVDLKPEDHHTNFDYRDTPPSGQGIVSLMHDTKSDRLPTPGPNRRSFAWGLAWAARREILLQHGLYDAMIVGGATRAVVHAMYGEQDRIAEAFQLTPEREKHYLRWANQFYQTVGKRIGYVEGRLYHLWHGSLDKRNYGGRYGGLAKQGFELSDIVIGANGAWHWARSKPDLEQFLMTHFIGRAEDG